MTTTLLRRSFFDYAHKLTVNIVKICVINAYNFRRLVLLMAITTQCMMRSRKRLNSHSAVVIGILGTQTISPSARPVRISTLNDAVFFKDLTRTRIIFYPLHDFETLRNLRMSNGFLSVDKRIASDHVDKHVQRVFDIENYKNVEMKRSRKKIRKLVRRCENEGILVGHTHSQQHRRSDFMMAADAFELRTRRICKRRRRHSIENTGGFDQTSVGRGTI